MWAAPDPACECNPAHPDRLHRRIRATHVLFDPFPEPEKMPPAPQADAAGKRPVEETVLARPSIDEPVGDEGKTEEELAEEEKAKEARNRAVVLEMVGDLPDADVKPPENVLFVCKLNPVTQDEDLELIFSRFGEIRSCEVIRDQQTGDSLQYAFIEFESQAQCEEAYLKMNNVLIDDRRIKVRLGPHRRHRRPRPPSAFGAAARRWTSPSRWPSCGTSTTASGRGARRRARTARRQHSARRGSRFGAVQVCAPLCRLFHILPVTFSPSCGGTGRDRWRLKDKHQPATANFVPSLGDDRARGGSASRPRQGGSPGSGERRASRSRREAQGHDRRRESSKRSRGRDSSRRVRRAGESRERKDEEEQRGTRRRRRRSRTRSRSRSRSRSRGEGRSRRHRR